MDDEEDKYMNEWRLFYIISIYSWKIKVGFFAAKNRNAIAGAHNPLPTPCKKSSARKK